jgi:SSS family solute:Na+ symporter
MIASHKFLVSMGLTNTSLFLLFWTIVIIYTAQGGLKAVISTDLVQAAFFSLVFVVGFIMVGLSQPDYVFIAHSESFDTSSKMFTWLLMPLLFIITEQDMGQRCFSGGSAQIVSRASFFSGLIMMAVCIVPVFFGVLARALNIEVAEGASVLMAAIEATTGPWMATFMGCAVLAAIISTATSLINAISSNLFNDFSFTYVRKIDSIKKITALISSGALISALYFDGIIDILTQSFELSVSCLFIPIAFALFYKKGRFLSAVLAIVGGAVGFVIFRMASPPFPREVMSILLSLTGFGLGFALERKLNIVTLINKEN